MADPITSSVNLWETAEKVGYSIVAIIGLVAVIKWLSGIHLKALTERIQTLEGIVTKRDKQIAERDEKIERMHQERLDATVSYAHDMKVIAQQLIANDKANRDVQRALIERLDARPCQMADPQPHPLRPEVPATDRTQRRG